MNSLTATPFNTRTYILVTLIVSLWVHASETFRYFLFIIPEMQSFLAPLENVAPISLPIFVIWGVWDTLLTGMVVLMYWLYTRHFGSSIRSVATTGILSWLFFFVLFWIGMWNMNLASPKALGIALPLSLMEMVVASFLAHWLYKR
ncbi:MAG: hypothetical protein KTR29_03570 [Rhodothermaceae bacterium]|nr:hypothetical protein [Rhodothermaceae bacterium]